MPERDYEWWLWPRSASVTKDMQVGEFSVDETGFTYRTTERKGFTTEVQLQHPGNYVAEVQWFGQIGNEPRGAISRPSRVRIRVEK